MSVKHERQKERMEELRRIRSLAGVLRRGKGRLIMAEVVEAGFVGKVVKVPLCACVEEIRQRIGVVDGVTRTLGLQVWLSRVRYLSDERLSSDNVVGLRQWLFVKEMMSVEVVDELPMERKAELLGVML